MSFQTFVQFGVCFPGIKCPGVVVGEDIDLKFY